LILVGGEAINTATLAAVTGSITVAGILTNSGLINVKSLMVTRRFVTTGNLTVITTGSVHIRLQVSSTQITLSL